MVLFDVQLVSPASVSVPGASDTLYRETSTLAAPLCPSPDAMLRLLYSDRVYEASETSKTTFPAGSPTMIRLGSTFQITKLFLK